MKKIKSTAIRSSALTFKADPFIVGAEAAFHYEADALIVMEDSKIKSFAAYTEEKKAALPADCELKTYKDSLVLPGLIDTHIHYPQTQIIGAYGSQLIDWLNNYTFIAEKQFQNFDYAKKVSEFFIDQCLKVGTTTMMTYCTVHPESVDAFFQAATEKNMRVIAGKVLMDRNAPPELLDTAKSGYDQSKALIKKWHGKDRLSYAITPRFAPTSTHEQLEACGALWNEHQGTYMQTHLSENLGEIAWVKELFPKHKDYLDVYDHYGLLGERAVFGHGIHLSEREWQRLYETKSSIAHCPTSNEFLGSGLFNFKQAKKENRRVRVGLATDIGAGTSFSQLQSMNESYKIAQLSGQSLSSIHAFYLATRGAAESLSLEDKIGSIEVGMEADLFVMNLKSSELIEFRMKYCKNIIEALFIQMMMADDRATLAVYIAGELAFKRS